MSELKEVDPRTLKISKYQPRQIYDIDNLMKSIKEYGITEEIQVNKHDNGDLVIIDGARRVKCALELGLKTVPIIIKRLSEQEENDLVMIDNIHRQDFNVIEMAHALKSYKEKWGVDDLALGRKFFPELSQSVKYRASSASKKVGRYLKLCSLPWEVQELALKNKLTLAPVYQIALLSLSDKEKEAAYQLELAGSALSYNKLKEKVDMLNAEDMRQQKKGEDREASKRRIEKELEEELKKALAEFVQNTGLEFAMPESYLQFNINDLKKTKDIKIEELNAQKFTLEEIDRNEKIIPVLQDLVFYYDEDEDLQKEFDKESVRALIKKKEGDITRHTKHNINIEKEVSRINTWFEPVSKIHKKIQGLLLKDSKPREGAKEISPYYLE